MKLLRLIILALIIVVCAVKAPPAYQGWVVVGVISLVTGLILWYQITSHS